MKKKKFKVTFLYWMRDSKDQNFAHAENVKSYSGNMAIAQAAEQYLKNNPLGVDPRITTEFKSVRIKEID